MAEPHAHSQPIETYSLAPHNRNIWPSPTPTANRYKQMAQRRIIETYGHTIAGRRSFVTPSRFFCLCWCPRSTHYCQYPNQMHVSGHRLRKLESIFYRLGLAILNSHNRIDSAYKSLKVGCKRVTNLTFYNANRFLSPPGLAPGDICTPCTPLATPLA